jgi:hypothetical protein
MRSKKDWQRCEKVCRISFINGLVTRCSSRKCTRKPIGERASSKLKDSVLADFYAATKPKARSPMGFLLSCLTSDTMRNVSGSVLNNPVTRANQSGEGGPRIEPGGKSERALSLSSANAKT